MISAKAYFSVDAEHTPSAAYAHVVELRVDTILHWYDIPSRARSPTSIVDFELKLEVTSEVQGQ